MSGLLGGKRILVTGAAMADIDGAEVHAQARRIGAASLEMDVTDGTSFRFARPYDRAGAFLLLLSELSSYITGQCIAVDGGLTATY